MNKPIRKSHFSIAGLIPSLFFCLAAFANNTTPTAKNEAEDVSPTITSLTPYNTKVGDTVVIEGTGFDFTTVMNNKVSFNNIFPNGVEYDSLEARVIAVTSTSITVTVPLGTINGNISVSVSGQYATSNGVYYNVVPTIASFVPDDGYVGDTITITGTGFDPLNLWVDNVWFTNGNNTSAISATTTSLRVVVPIGSTTGPITVFTNTPKTTSSFNFSVVPRVTSLEENQGQVGASVTLDGTGFDPTQKGNYQLTFNSIPAIITSVTSISIETSVPPHASSGPIVLTFNGTIVKGSGRSFVVNPTPPEIYKYSVNSGTVGTPVTITGAGFDQFDSPPEVDFNGVTAAIGSYDYNAIYTSVPLGAASGPISVTVAGHSTIGSDLTFRVLETITGMLPTHAKVGDTVVVKGTGFYPYNPTNYYSVQFPNASVNVISVTDTTIEFVVPPMATSCVPVIHSIYFIGVSITLPYLGIIPTITSISPDTVITGRNQILTITGTGFGTYLQRSEIIFSQNIRQMSFRTKTFTQIETSVPVTATTGPLTVVIDSLSATTPFDLVVLPDTFPYKPTPPVLFYTSVSTTSFTYNWTRPYRALGYLLDVSTNNFATLLPGYNSFFTTDTVRSITGLLDGTNYQLRIRAYSDTDTSGYSFATTITLPLPPIAAPPYKIPPNDFVASWSPSRGAEGYRLEVSDNNFESFIWGIIYDTHVLVLVSSAEMAPSFQYRVMAFNSSGYSQYSNTAVLIVTEVSPTANSPTLYPNPTNDFINLAGLNAAILEPSLIDAMGRSTTVSLQKVGDDQIKLDVRALSGGLYVLRLVTDRGAIELRFIKQ
jgi:hypothetical protein